MNDLTKTILFVAIAIGIGGAAVGTHFATKPRVAITEDLVGKPLFPTLEAEQVKSLEVVARDPVSQSLRRFKVENRDGVWRIPSHHNYPAEAAKRLFETATALYGLDRLALAGRWSEDQRRFAVLAPDGDGADAADPEEIGKRVVLRDANEEILADLIVGKAADVENANAREDAFEKNGAAKKRFYVRSGEESETYVANLNVDLSTRFADWIEPDLLQIDQQELNKVVIDNYELQVRDELTNRGTVRRIGKLDKGRHELLRVKPFDPWTLNGLDPAKEELNSQNYSKILNLLDDMIIVGVRPKLQLEGKPLLNPDLTVNTDFETFRKDPAAFQEALFNLQSELMSYGFNVVPGNSQGEKPAFYSNRGELFLSNNQGIAYNLYFGDSVQGSDEAIEIGAPATPPADNAVPISDGSEATANGDAAKADQTTDAHVAAAGEAQQNAPEQAANDPSADPTKPDTATSTKRNRYLMVRVSFDVSALGSEPVEPTAPIEPTKPEGYVASTVPNQPPSQNPTDVPPTPPQDTRDAAFIQYDQQLAEYKTALQKFELDADQYKRDSEDYKNRREEGERKTKRLNDRFGPWFYVISAEDLESIQIARTDLVRPKPAPQGEPGDVPPAPMELPARPDISL